MDPSAKPGERAELWESLDLLTEYQKLSGQEGRVLCLWLEEEGFREFRRSAAQATRRRFQCRQCASFGYANLAPTHQHCPICSRFVPLLAPSNRT